MASTQYIGARYVPLFYTNPNDGTNAWLSGVEYEPLTIVTYLNQSYTSKIPVPASIGNPADNPTYWILTGSYNAQVAQLQSDVDDLQDDVDDLTAATDMLETYHNGKYILISDSYGNPIHGNVVGFTHDLLAVDGIDSIPLYADGGSFHGGNFLAVLQTQAALMTADEKAEIAKIVVAAGINDAHSDTDYDIVVDNIEAFCIYCRNTFPNAKVYLGYIGNTQSNSSILNGRDLNSIADAIGCYARCGEFGAAFLSNLEYVLHDYSLLDTDGVHPNSVGGREIAKYLISALQTGSADIKRYYRSTNSAEFWDASTGVSPEIYSVALITPLFPNASFYIYQDNGTETIQMRYRLAVNFETATDMTIAANTSLMIGQLKTDLWQPKSQGIYPLIGAIKQVDQSITPCRGHLTINGKQIYLRFDTLGDNWGTQQILHVTNILFTPQIWTVPTMMC